MPLHKQEISIVALKYFKAWVEDFSSGKNNLHVLIIFLAVISDNWNQT